MRAYLGHCPGSSTLFFLYSKPFGSQHLHRILHLLVCCSRTWRAIFTCEPILFLHLTVHYSSYSHVRIIRIDVENAFRTNDRPTVCMLMSPILSSAFVWIFLCLLFDAYVKQVNEIIIVRHSIESKKLLFQKHILYFVFSRSLRFMPYSFYCAPIDCLFLIFLFDE